jgi:hypothetical protein
LASFYPQPYPSSVNQSVHPSIGNNDTRAWPAPEDQKEGCLYLFFFFLLFVSTTTLPAILYGRSELDASRAAAISRVILVMLGFITD